ncbi:hypothetical protein GCM10007989_14530 [Devosia pacifica]|uniref:Blue-light-activated histidine kinase n=2 Tax=Devosia pacifica TaxID=1335967 RepID=A0A918S457_9HYPH|nr:hypothetical protein GCM10007989_14530 [Devosia pacifica]
MFEAFPSPTDSPSYKLLKASFDKVLESQRPDQIALIPYDTSLPDEPAKMRYWSATHTPLFDTDGHFFGILQHTVDITELQELRAEYDARQSAAQAGLLGRARAVQNENLALAVEADRLRSLFVQAPSFMAVLRGPEHIFEMTNDAYMRLVGADRPLIGRRLAEALPEVVDQGFEALLEQVRQTGEPYIGRGVQIALAKHADGELEQAYLDFIYAPLRDADGAVTGVFVQGHDITEQKLAEQALTRQSEMLQLAQEAGGVGTFEWDLEKDLLYGSPQFWRLYGVEPRIEPMAVEHFEQLVHPEDRPRLASQNRDQLVEGPQKAEYRVLTNSGVRWIGRQARVHVDDSGRAVRVFGAAHDLTERKAFEERLEIIAGESAHRVKNMLTMVQAIVSQTLRGATDMASARVTINDRLAALGQAQDSLGQTSAKSADLEDVVKKALALHSDTFGRLEISGDPVRVSAEAVLGLGLMLHELATNAVKYGALSAPDGRVAVAWKHQSDGKVVLTWLESGGPAVQPPQRVGFGSRLIERGLNRTEGQSVDLEYAETGVVCTIKLNPVDDMPSPAHPG